MMPEEKKQEFLARIKSEGRSSPVGKHWADFHDLLWNHQEAGVAERPPVPLILAASGASNRAKHQRLSDQLDWAIASKIFNEAIAFLEKLEIDNWNHVTPDNWDDSSMGYNEMQKSDD